MPDYRSSTETSRMFAGRRPAMVFRSIIAILFAVLAFVWLRETVPILMNLFAGYALIDGVCILIAGMGSQHRPDNRWLLALEGIVGMALAILVLRSPVVSAVALLYYISIWVVALGFLRIIEAILLRKEISGEMWLPVSGVVAILFGVTLMLRPHRMGAVAIIWLIAGYALVTGLFEVLLGIELRRPPEVPSPRRSNTA